MIRPLGESRTRYALFVGASTEGYKNRADCVANAKRFGYTGN